MQKILIAEDDLMIADMVADTFIEQGFEVCGIARTVPEAVALARRHAPGFLLLDLRLADGGLGTEIAAELTDMSNLGILYATANVSQVRLTAADGHAYITKPYRAADLIRGVEIVTKLIATGVALPPFPRGFHILPPATSIRSGKRHG